MSFLQLLILIALPSGIILFLIQRVHKFCMEELQVERESIAMKGRAAELLADKIELKLSTADIAKFLKG
jgi:hypothetical protein